jgi:hypothetical protein
MKVEIREAEYSQLSLDSGIAAPPPRSSPCKIANIIKEEIILYI